MLFEQLCAVYVFMYSLYVTLIAIYVLYIIKAVIYTSVILIMQLLCIYII